MKTTCTDIIFLLDRSVSMGGLESDTIGGFNSFVDRQSKLEGKTNVTTVLFDDEVEILWSGMDANEVKLTEQEYFVRGTTALLDAVGKTILTVSSRFSSLGKEKPDNVIFVITTDGLENASKEFTYGAVNELINKKRKSGWEFIFMGANIDAAQEAHQLGISSENAYQFEATEHGVEQMYKQVFESVAEKRLK